MNSTDVDRFFKRLTKSGLLDAENLRQAARILRDQPDFKLALDKLITNDLLTRWQARQLIGEGSPRFFIGQYKLLKELGQGGMGTVYRAVHPAMHRVVALKVMSHDFLTDRKKVARFQREIRTAAALDHPHIVRALDAGHEGDTHYLVMEHIDGRDVGFWIDAAGQLPVSWCCKCLRQVASGLQHAWGHGVTHRDLKPSNLLVQGKSLEIEPTVKIVDFGLARVGDDLAGEDKLTRVGRTVGTWAYISPEQALDASCADIRSDIYSLGCTMFHMISGRLPFQGKTDLETLMMRMKHDAPRLSCMRDGIDSRLDEILAKMLARDPSERFQSPAEVAEVLQIFADAPISSKSRAEIRLAYSNSRTNEDSMEIAFRKTDSEFQQFLETIPDLKVRSLVAPRPEVKKPVRRLPFWWLHVVALVVCVAILAMVLWGLIR